MARVRFQDIDDGDFARAACVDGVVLLGLGLRRVHRDVDAGSEHERGVGIARRLGAAMSSRAASRSLMSSRFGHAKRKPVIGETISAIALPTASALT